MTDPPRYTAHEFSPDTSPATAVAEQPQPSGLSKDKPVVVTGAAGLVGSHLCEQLVKAGWTVRAIAHSMPKAASRLGHLPVEIRTGDVRNVSDMRSALAGAGAVVHLVAVAIEKGDRTYADVNTDGTRVVIDSARAESVRRFVFMSQNGADSSSPYPFLRSKGAAEDLVHDSSLDWSALRPSVIFGPEDEFVNVLARLIRLSPLVFPLPGGGTAKFQPVAVDDVARAVIRILEDDATIRHTFEIGGPAELSLRQMTERILIAMNASRILVPAPVGLLRPIVGIAQRILPNPPVTTGLLDLLDLDNVVARNDLTERLGITPVPFAPEELIYLRKITLGSALKSLVG